MRKSLMIAAYLANIGSPDRSERLGKQPPRPSGNIIWARCLTGDQVMAIEALDRKLQEDGDPIHIVTTLHNWQPEYAERALPEPHGKHAIREFIAHWKPTMGIWVGGGFDPRLIAEMLAAKLNLILVDAAGDGLDQVAGTWVPGAMRSLLSAFEAILALDHYAAERLIKAGAPEDLVLVTGPMEDCAPALPCDEEERGEIAGAIGTRPVWLAAGAGLDETKELCAAHGAISRRTHRSLLVVVPQNPIIGFTMAEDMRQLGFQVARRSQQSLPEDTTQIFIIDTDDDIGLWYRVAPITYLGGTLKGTACRDPFEPTALGSAVIYGPHIHPFEKHAGRLNAAGASRLLRGAADLAPAIEGLLSPDKAAAIAHAAWDVTSRGANVTNRVAAFIQLRLEETVH